MKSKFTTAISIGVAVMAFQVSSRADEQPAAASTNQTEKLSYSVGMSIGNSIKRGGFEVDPETVSQGIKDVLAGRPTKFTDKEAQQTIMAYQQELRAKHDQERVETANKNHKEGEEFLAANKQKAGVKTLDAKLPNGSTAELQYKVLTEGTGETPTGSDTVVLNMKGTLPNGKQFDESKDRKLPLNRIPVRGITDALEHMKTGAKWEIYLPSTLAYGDYPGPNVEPGSAVIYDVELMSIEHPQPMTSDIIKVPSAEELKKGAKIEVIKPEDVKRMQEEAAKTNSGK